MNNCLFSQTQYRWGLAGGVNAARLINSTEDTKPINGFHVGLIGEAKYNNHFGIKLGALSSSKGSIFKEKDNLNQIHEKEFKLTYVDIPILANWYFLKVFSFQIGTQTSFLLNAEYQGDSVKNKLKITDISMVSGIGFDAYVLNAAIRYNYGLLDIGSGIGKNSVLQITLGLWIK